MNKAHAADELVFLPLGGSGEIGMNMNLYGFGPDHDRKWVMIDCGVMFGDMSMPGIDLVMPDIDYILEYKNDLEGLVLTHGHEDHIGAVAILAPLLECPIYATPFTAALLKRKFEERNEDISRLQIIDMGAQFELGPFHLELVTLTHSIPEPSGVILSTPLGKILHTGDWKIDRTPTLGPKTDQNRLQRLGDDGLLAMVCDSTNVLSPGESGSESDVRDQLIEIIGRQEGRVAVTTFASNLARVVSICHAAKAADRSVCLLGRSMLKIVEAAREANLISSNIQFISPEEAGFIPRNHVLYLCTGSQGEPRAALSRIARDDHRDLVLSSGDTVIFSSKIIPGNEREIYDLQNLLVDLGVKIITEKDEMIHVSGHPCQDELKTMYEWARPQIAIPVHGEARHLETHAEFTKSLGIKESIALRNGDMIRLAPGNAAKVDEVPTGRMVLDGDCLSPLGATPVRERRKLGWAGLCVVSLTFRKNSTLATDPIIELIGTVKKSDDGYNILEELKDDIIDMIKDLSPQKRIDDDAITQNVKRTVRDAMSDMWGKRPMISVLIHRVS